jgi:hypothetical protein
MDLSNANTEAFIQFHRFHEHLNRTIKTLVIGLGLTAEAIEQGRSASSINDLLYDRGWLWGGMPDWRDPGELIDEARQDIGRTGVTRAFSAFDFFLDGIEADLASWAHRSSHRIDDGAVTLAANSDDESDEADRLVGFYRRLNAPRSNIEFLWPVYRYFRLARDCIIHRRGIASQAAADASRSEAIVAAVTEWTKRTGELNPVDVPPLNAGENIAFVHRHAILASSVLRLIANDLNTIALVRLGVEGVVFLAARRLFFDKPPGLPILSTKSVQHAMHGALADRYRVMGLTAAETRQIMRDLDIWQPCNRRLTLLKEAQDRTPPIS